jgi:hypothetical protein
MATPTRRRLLDGVVASGVQRQFRWMEPGWSGAMPTDDSRPLAKTNI